MKSPLKLVDTNAKYDNLSPVGNSDFRPPRTLTKEQRAYITAMQRLYVPHKLSTLALEETENILVGNLQSYHGASTDQQNLLRSEAKRNRIFRFNGEPL
ncbi:MAG TPA: hypothetical protein VMU25_02945 [Candidatus Paceibacterota bacterium]|nr:hypothetical protein [Candidatus Paceibacterota bacterium]